MPSAEIAAAIDGTPEGVLVVGMHRSGTSATTRLLNLLGLQTCRDDDLLMDPRGNAKGHWESQTMLPLNLELLAQMGRTWWCPPRAGDAYFADAAGISLDPDDAAGIFDTVHPTRPWVWKDPRTSMLLPFWRGALRRPIAAVVVFRNPLDVAESLRSRNEFSIPQGVAMWERTNRLLLEHLSGLPVRVTRYDDLVDDPVEWSRGTQRFLAGCGMATDPAVDVDAIHDFVAADLRHSRHTWLDVLEHAASVEPVLEALHSCAGDWERFERPDLRPEPDWVEAQLVSVGGEPEVRLRDRSARSLIVIADGDLTTLCEQLATEVTAAGEVIVVADESLPRPAHLPDGLRVVPIPAAATRGAARAAGAAAARGGVLEFRNPGTVVSRNWGLEMRRALAAGYAAVSPAVKRADAPGYGMAWSGQDLRVSWNPRPRTALATVNLLAADCFAVIRSAWADIGGGDPGLGHYGLDVQELSVRLWRHGHRCAVARDADASPAAGAGAPAAPVDWAGFSHDLLRLAVLHLPESVVTHLAAALRERPGAADALTAVMVSDAGATRQALEAGGCEDAGRLIPGWREPASAGAAVTPVSAEPAATPVAVSVIVSGRFDADDLTPRLISELGSVEVLAAADRAAAARASHGELLLFVAGRLPERAGWGPLLLTALADPSVAAVGPALRLGRHLVVPGIQVTPDLTAISWRERANVDCQLPAVTDDFLLVRRSAYQEVGGHDPLLEATMADLDLGLRLSRAGWQCRAMADVVVVRDRPLWRADPASYDAALRGLLRLAAVQLDAADNESLIASQRSRRGFVEAMARVASQDLGPRRRRSSGTATESAATVLSRLGSQPEAVPAK